MKYYIGIDVGTSGTKSVLFNQRGEDSASANYDYNIISPKPGYAEENPLDWWNGVKFTLGELQKLGHNRDVFGIGISGQMHGLVLLDKEDTILRNAIIWCDTRCDKEKEEILSHFTADELKKITGNVCMSAFTLAKLLWVKNNEPEIYARIDKVMLPKDYIIYQLTGVFSADYSDASGTQWLNLEKLIYADEILNAFQIPLNWLGTLHDSSENIGYLKPELASHYDLMQCQVCAGAGDQACGAVGGGIVTSNDMSIVLGSSGVVFAPLDSLFVAEKGEVQTFCHAIKGKYHVMGVTNACGTSLKWYRQTLDYRSYDMLMEEAKESAPGANGILYLPYLMGERTPHLDDHAKGIFFGLRNTTTKGDMIRSVIEGVGYSLKDCYQMLGEKKNRRAVISGGGAKSPLWKEIIASMLETDVSTIQSEEGPALGAAILAMVANKEYPSVVDACSAIIKIKETTKINLQWKEIYAKMHVFYQALYQQNKNLFVEAYLQEEEK